MANGFGNRFLWFAVKSNKVMSDTKPIPEDVFKTFTTELRTLLGNYVDSDNKPIAMPVVLSDEAQSKWGQLYEQLREDRPGFAGAMTARGPSMVIRLSLIYALLDKKTTIGVEHLEAALAVWRYCEASATMLFGGKSGGGIREKLIQLLNGGPMTKMEFNKHLTLKEKGEVDKVLSELEATERIRRTKIEHEGPGRPATLWELVPVK